jgi:HAD superfamily hydrolase (TIGR01549 family)
MLLPIAQTMTARPGVFDAFKPERVLETFLESDRITTADFNAGAPSEGLRDVRSNLFLRLLGIREDHAATISELYVRNYPMVKAPLAGAIPVVKELSRKFSVGVVSNGFPDVQYRKLETMGLRDLFSCIVLSEEIGIRKPDPRIFHRATSLLNMQSSECLYIGDSYTNDIIGAKTAGMLTCWLNRESSEQKNESIKADFVISKLEEPPVLLRR